MFFKSFQRSPSKTNAFECSEYVSVTPTTLRLNKKILPRIPPRSLKVFFSQLNITDLTQMNSFALEVPFQFD